ncbi:MAG: hypothetical protein FJ270_05245, partial [Planctomycetes bacterium]|nr:hypothetical protein [Planctomycetota bacterium]
MRSALVLLLPMAFGPLAAAQQVDLVVNGESLAGFVLPVEPVDGGLTITAERRWEWTTLDTKRLWLEGDVLVNLGDYAFSAPSASVWINRIPSAGGLITQYAVYFPVASEPTRYAGIGAGGKELLVTGSTRGAVQLTTVLTDRGAPAGRPELGKGVARLQRHLRGIATGAPVLEQLPDIDVTPTPPETPISVGAPIRASTDATALPPVTIRTADTGTVPIIAGSATVSWFGGSILLDSATDSVTITGGVQIDATGMRTDDGPRDLQLSAESSVVFLEPGTLAALKAKGKDASPATTLSALDIVGIYLEGDVVATDYQYTIRCRHMYYDLVRNKAYAADAVLRTVDRKGMLLVARAAEMQQVAGRQWRVGESTLSSSEFFVPHLSVGVSRATVTQTAAGDSFVIADDVTGRIGRVPFFWMPTVQGSLDRMPIKGVQLGYGDPEGTVFGVELDPFVLLGLQRERGLDATLEAGVQSEYGINAGLRMKGDAGGKWNADFFGVYDFGNPEQTANSGDVVSPIEWRGMVTADWVLQSSPDADTRLQLGVQSDPTLVSIFRPDDYQERRPYETAAWTTSSTDNSIFDFGASISANDWVSTMWQLASRPYTTEKYPELNYRRYGDRIFGSAVTWSSEYSGSVMSLNIQDTDSDEIGADPDAISVNPLFAASQNIREAYEGAGYDSDIRGRVATRQELALPLDVGDARITPFASANGIGYFFNDFNDYSSESDSVRGLLAGGVRASTTFTASYDTVRSRLLDLERLRHVIKPYGMLWYGWDSNDLTNYPIYDQEWEGWSGGTVGQAGIDQRLQTMRGGPGNWQSVDWVTVDAGVVVDDRGNDLQRTTNTPGDTFGLKNFQSPMPSFYAWRPEYSQWGDHLYGQGTWALGDALGLYGMMTWMLEDRDSQGDDLAQGSLGFRIEQSPAVTWYTEYRYVNTFDDTGEYPDDELLQGGLQYRVSENYNIA